MCSLVVTVAKMGKEEFVDDIQQKISDKMEIKASLQALHLKEEQLKMPEGLKQDQKSD